LFFNLIKLIIDLLSLWWLWYWWLWYW